MSEKFTDFVYFGTGEFAATVLRILISREWIPRAIVTNPDRPVGRKKEITPSAVGSIADEHGINTFKFETLDSGALESLQALGVQVAVVTDYGSIIPEAFLNIYPKGSVNIHPSLLPKYRGASPIQSAILAGETSSGVAVMQMDEKMDHGGIIQKEEIEIKNESYTELRDKLAQLGSEVLIDSLPRYLNGSLKPKEQNHDKATFTKLIQKTDGKIDWSKHTAKHIERMIRAFDPWPGVSTHIPKCSAKKNGDAELLLQGAASIKQGSGGLRVKVLSAKSIDSPAAESGSITKSPDGPVVACANSTSLMITRLQVEGKNPVDGRTFLNGYQKLDKFE